MYVQSVDKRIRPKIDKSSKHHKINYKDDMEPWEYRRDARNEKYIEEKLSTPLNFHISPLL
jgi:hypothetical protein